MNPLQMAQQIKAELQAIVWPDGSGQVVFGSQEGRVLVFAEGPPDPSQLSPAFPFALVIVEEGTFDEDDPTLIASQGFSVIVAAQVAGDPYGEVALIGGAQANLGTSPGKGVLELSERARAAVQDLVGSDGAKVILSGTATSRPGLISGKHCAFADVRLTATCTSALAFAAPQQLVNSGVGQTWQGAHCSDRFDFVQYRMGWKAGSTPAETPAETTAIVYTGATAAASITTTSSRTYSVFADYNKRGGSTVENSSSGSRVGAYFTT